MARSMPESLEPDGGLVRQRDMDEDDPLENVRTGHIPIEEQLARQIDRIAYLRSAGLPWGEAVLHLRDMVVGLEDEEFFDGVPQKVRDQIDQGTADVSMEQAKALYAEYGWESVSVRAYETETGRHVLDPAPADYAKLYRIIQRLLARKGLVFKRKTRTRFAPYGEDQIEDEQEGA